MATAKITAQLRRFILTSISSVPHLEAILLLRNEPGVSWHGAAVAQRLYIGEKNADLLLQELTSAGIIQRMQAEPPGYRYQPATAELGDLIEQLADAYSRNLLEVTHLIHSTTDRRAQRFADAFKLRRDT